MKHTKDFAEVVRAKLAADQELAREVDQAAFYAELAAEIYEVRNEAKLTQKELAKLIGTGQSVISRLEDAEYFGHSTDILLRIAFALGKRLHVGFYSVPETEEAAFTQSISMNWTEGIQTDWQPIFEETLSIEETCLVGES